MRRCILYWLLAFHVLSLLGSVFSFIGGIQGVFEAITITSNSVFEVFWYFVLSAIVLKNSKWLNTQQICLFLFLFVWVCVRDTMTTVVYRSYGFAYRLVHVADIFTLIISWNLIFICIKRWDLSHQHYGEEDEDGEDDVTKTIERCVCVLLALLSMTSVIYSIILFRQYQQDYSTTCFYVQTPMTWLLFNYIILVMLVCVLCTVKQRTDDKPRSLHYWTFCAMTFLYIGFNLPLSIHMYAYQDGHCGHITEQYGHIPKRFIQFQLIGNSVIPVVILFTEKNFRTTLLSDYFPKRTIYRELRNLPAIKG